MKINYHIHTSYSGDMIREGRTSETPEKYVKAAIEKGFDEICFTDHVVVGYPLAERPYSHGMPLETIDIYTRAVRTLAKKYPEIKIRLGIELDWYAEKAKEIRAFLEKHSFDCVLGSVHVLDGHPIEHSNEEKRKAFWESRSMEEIYARHADYYRVLQGLVRSKICDIVSHVDIVKRDGYMPEKSLWHLIEETIELIAQAGLCVEVNTRGIKKPIGEMHPSPEILALCKKKGIPVTIGTDAHWVKEIDLYYEEGINLIRSVGYDRIAVFEGRKMRFVKI